MFQHTSAILFIFIALLFTGCVNSKINDPQPQVKSVNKLVTFNIYTDNDFSDARWSDSKVQINLRISRIRQNPYEQKTEFDTTLAWIEFKDLPDAIKKIQVAKRITIVNTNQEAISASYSYTTSIDGYEMSAGKEDFIEKWEAKKELDIHL